MAVAPAATYTPKPHAPGPMEGVRATKMGDALAAAGLDVRNLPPHRAADARAEAEGDAHVHRDARRAVPRLSRGGRLPGRHAAQADREAHVQRDGARTDAARRRARLLRQLSRRHDVHARSPRHGEAHEAHERDARRPVRARRRARPRLHHVSRRAARLPHAHDVEDDDGAGHRADRLAPERGSPVAAAAAARAARPRGLRTEQRAVPAAALHARMGRRSRPRRTTPRRSRSRSIASRRSRPIRRGRGRRSAERERTRRGAAISAEANKSCETCHELYQADLARTSHRTRTVP